MAKLLQKLNTMERIVFNPNVMGGKPCIRGMRITVGTVMGLLAKGYSNAEILNIYPYLEVEDIQAALLYFNNLKK